MGQPEAPLHTRGPMGFWFGVQVSGLRDLGTRVLPAVRMRRSGTVDEGTYSLSQPDRRAPAADPAMTLKQISQISTGCFRACRRCSPVLRQKLVAAPWESDRIARTSMRNRPLLPVELC